jgi:hypothetical protein
MKAGFQSSRNATESRRWSQLQVNSLSRTPGGAGYSQAMIAADAIFHF